MTNVSLDGFVAGPRGEIDWGLVDDELHRHFNDVVRSAGAFLNGRVTYELMAAYWPTADADPAAPAPVAEFAAIWRSKPKIVFSRTLDRVAWNATLARDVVPGEVERWTAEFGADLLLGGARLAATFMRLDLIDEYRLYVHPVAIGRGQPLFPGDVTVRLQLVASRAFGNGVVLLRYRRPSVADGA
jgi:dihydrofolate reductase